MFHDGWQNLGKILANYSEDLRRVSSDLDLMSSTLKLAQHPSLGDLPLPGAAPAFSLASWICWASF